MALRGLSATEKWPCMSPLIFLTTDSVFRRLTFQVSILGTRRTPDKLTYKVVIDYSALAPGPASTVEERDIEATKLGMGAALSNLHLPLANRARGRGSRLLRRAETHRGFCGKRVGDPTRFPRMPERCDRLCAAVAPDVTCPSACSLARATRGLAASFAR